jgi:hypothetical protein
MHRDSGRPASDPLLIEVMSHEEHFYTIPFVCSTAFQKWLMIIDYDDEQVCGRQITGTKAVLAGEVLSLC